MGTLASVCFYFKSAKPRNLYPIQWRIIMDVKILMEPEKYGYEVCQHCNGYWSSFKDPENSNICSKCDGHGVVKKKD